MKKWEWLWNFDGVVFVIWVSFSVPWKEIHMKKLTVLNYIENETNLFPQFHAAPHYTIPSPGKTRTCRTWKLEIHTFNFLNLNLNFVHFYFYSASICCCCLFKIVIIDNKKTITSPFFILFLSKLASGRCKWCCKWGRTWTRNPREWDSRERQDSASTGRSQEEEKEEEEETKTRWNRKCQGWQRLQETGMCRSSLEQVANFMAIQKSCFVWTIKQAICMHIVSHPICLPWP